MHPQLRDDNHTDMFAHLCPYASECREPLSSIWCVGLRCHSCYCSCRGIRDLMICSTGSDGFTFSGRLAPIG